MGVWIYRLLGVTMGGASWIDVVLIQGVDGALPAVFLQGLLLFTLFIGRVAFRAWVVALWLVLLGTPVALYSGHETAMYLWNNNISGITWENMIPQAIALSLAWVLHLPVSWLLRRYRVVVVRNNSDAKSPCPRCGYDLFRSRDACPECGWQIPQFHATTCE